MATTAEMITEQGPGSGRGRSLRARRALFLLAGVAAAALIGWLVYYQLYAKYWEGTDDAYVQADVISVGAKVSGYVDRVFVEDNQEVTAGQPLVSIDAREYRAKTAEISAQMRVSDARASNVLASIAEQQATVEEARARLATAQTAAAYSAGEVERYEPLARSGAETGERLAALRKQARDAVDQVFVQRAVLASAQQRVRSLKAQLDGAFAEGQAVQSQLSAANVDLGFTIVRASSKGRVGNKGARVGQFVQPGTRLMSIVPVQKIYVVANFKETQITRIRRGQPVEVKVDALPGVVLDGRVDSISPATGAQFSILPPQNATGNFIKIVQRVPVRIALDPGPRARAVLIPGLSVNVEIDTRSAKSAEVEIRDEEEHRDGKGS